MSTAPTFTYAELVAFLEDASHAEPPPDYHTTEEWAGIYGVNNRKMSNLMNRAFALGKLEMIKVHRDARDGRRALVPVYRFRMED